MRRTGKDSTEGWEVNQIGAWIKGSWAVWQGSDGQWYGTRDRHARWCFHIGRLGPFGDAATARQALDE